MSNSINEIIKKYIILKDNLNIKDANILDDIKININKKINNKNNSTIKYILVKNSKLGVVYKNEIKLIFIGNFQKKYHILESAAVMLSPFLLKNNIFPRIYIYTNN